jgi:colicin import membrane protein
MSDRRSQKEGADVEFVNELVAASRLDRPRDGAKARALAAVVPSLGLVPSTGAERGRGAPILASFAGLAVLAALVLGGLFLRRQSDMADAALREQQAGQAAQQAKVDKLIGDLREQSGVVARLRAAVASARDDAERQAAEQALAQAKAREAAAAGALSGESRPPTPPVSPRPRGLACNCAPGDPLCSCIP